VSIHWSKKIVTNELEVYKFVWKLKHN